MVLISLLHTQQTLTLSSSACSSVIVHVCIDDAYLKRLSSIILVAQEQMDAADVPYHYRDYCAHAFIDYKECRLTSGFSWRTKCHHELHAYNKCEYKEFKVRQFALARHKRKKCACLRGHLVRRIMQRSCFPLQFPLCTFEGYHHAYLRALTLHSS